MFVVDRDPRDVYLLGKYYWKDGICPTDPYVFCDWYEYTHKAGSTIEDHNNIFRLRFEDLIYKYDETVNSIERITGLNPLIHTRKYQKLNPLKSIKNTRLWERHSNDHGLEIIRMRLNDYFYDYSTVDLENIVGTQVENIKPF